MVVWQEKESEREGESWEKEREIKREIEREREGDAGPSSREKKSMFQSYQFVIKTFIQTKHFSSAHGHAAALRSAESKRELKNKTMHWFVQLGQYGLNQNGYGNKVGGVFIYFFVLCMCVCVYVYMCVCVYACMCV